MRSAVRDLHKVCAFFVVALILGTSPLTGCDSVPEHETPKQLRTVEPSPQVGEAR